MADFSLSDVDIFAVSLCKGPANRKRFYLKKQEAEPTVTSPAPHRLIKESGDDWSVVYAVVAAPDWEEQSGVGRGAEPGKTDVWASPDEIRLAAHRFMKNGGLINRQHEDMLPYGRLVENFIAPVDMEIGDELIKAGSWCIGIEPTDEGRAMIESGEWDGVSYEGDGLRTPVAKASDRAPAATYGKCDSCGGKVKRGAKTCGNCGKAVTLKKAISAEAVAQAHGPIMNLVRFYMKKKHPFRACVRDNTKRFGKERAEQVCARLKDIGHGGNTDWRSGFKKSEDLPFELIDTMAHNWVEAGLDANDATMALEDAMQSDDRNLLQKIADKLGISETDETDNLDREDEMNDAEREQLAKVEGLEAQVTELTKEDGRLSTIEATLEEIKNRLPEPDENEGETAAELVKQMEKLEADHEALNTKLEKLGEGRSEQSREAEDLKKKDNPEAALAAALLD